MIARAAQWNMSVFDKRGLRPETEVAREYLRLALRYDNRLENTKFCLSSILRHELTSELGQSMTSAQSMAELCAAFGLETLYAEIGVPRERAREQAEAAGDESQASKRARLDPTLQAIVAGEEDGLTLLPVTYKKRDFGGVPPKSLLSMYLSRQHKDQPVYTTTQRAADKKFISICR